MEEVKPESGNGLVTLILGDDNFTFTLPFLESPHHWARESVEVASCLPEEQIPDDYRPNYLALRAQGVTVHFAINPAQLRNHFFNNQYSRIVFILPGLAFSGFPDFLDKKADPLFRLRLHIYMFGFLKSSRNALKTDSVIQIVWPRQEDRSGDLPPWVPWHGMNLSKIGPFCEVFRSEADDEPLDITAFQDWHPLIHGIQTDSCPAYLQDSMFYSWRLTPPPNSPEDQDDSEKKVVEDKEDQNLLFVPPELWTHPVEAIPHVNELFKFELRTNTKELAVVSKPTLKFDPRFRADGAPAKNPFVKRGGSSSSGAQRSRRSGGGRGMSHMEPFSQGQGGSGMACGIQSGSMPPPPPPPSDLFKQAALAAASAELYGQLPPGCSPPHHQHPGLVPQHMMPSLYANPHYMNGMGQSGYSTRGWRHDLLLQDELSLQYGGADLLMNDGRRDSRYDLLDTADMLDPSIDYDAYRAMELGFPMTDQFGIPLYNSEIDLINDPGGPSLMPAGLEHEDVLLYERHGGQLGGDLVDLMQAGPSESAVARLDEQDTLLSSGPYNDHLLDADPLLDSRLMIDNRRRVNSDDRLPIYRGRPSSVDQFDDPSFMRMPSQHAERPMRELGTPRDTVDCDGQDAVVPSAASRSVIDDNRHPYDGNRGYYHRKGSRDINRDRNIRRSSSIGTRRIVTREERPSLSRQETSEARHDFKSRSVQRQPRGRRTDSRITGPDWSRQSRSRSRGNYRDAHRGSDRYQYAQSPLRGSHRDDDTDHRIRSRRYSGQPPRLGIGKRSRSRDQYRYGSRSPPGRSPGRRPPQRR